MNRPTTCPKGHTTEWLTEHFGICPEGHWLVILRSGCPTTLVTQRAALEMIGLLCDVRAQLARQQPVIEAAAQSVKATLDYEAMYAGGTVRSLPSEVVRDEVTKRVSDAENALVEALKAMKEE